VSVPTVPVLVTAGPRTDWFVDPGTGAVTASAPAELFAVDGDFIFSARVEAELAETVDAGALVVWVDDRTWAKLALERSPAGVPTIVSVVTRDVSDDCNSWPLPSPTAWLRIARIGPAYAFHASQDGTRWELVRHFRLETAATRVGFEAQSPLGDGCNARFSAISFAAATLGDIRSGE
jgi:regulation of enolase protein 1 (concanavalin A-like superfamily)